MGYGYDMAHPGGRSESKLNDTQRTFSLDSDWIPAEVKWMNKIWQLIVWWEMERDLYDVYLEESLLVDYFSFWGRAALGVEALQRETPAIERETAISGLVLWTYCLSTHCEVVEGEVQVSECVRERLKVR